MYEQGRLMKFTPFKFKNGASPKPKYFLVLGTYRENIIIASLPTSKDHIPVTLSQEYGCTNDNERNVNAFVFKANKRITECFAFPRKTFVYAEQVDEYALNYLKGMDANIEDLGLLEIEVFKALIDCLIKSAMLKRKFRRIIENA